MSGQFEMLHVTFPCRIDRAAFSPSEGYPHGPNWKEWQSLPKNREGTGQFSGNALVTQGGRAERRCTSGQAVRPSSRRARGGIGRFRGRSTFGLGFRKLAPQGDVAEASGGVNRETAAQRLTLPVPLATGLNGGRGAARWRLRPDSPNGGVADSLDEPRRRSGRRQRLLSKGGADKIRSA
jgi:hypothetical protein